MDYTQTPGQELKIFGDNKNLVAYHLQQSKNSTNMFLRNSVKSIGVDRVYITQIRIAKCFLSSANLEA